MLMIGVELDGATVVIAGGGKVASRRARMLVDEGASVVVVAPEARADIEEWAHAGAVTWVRRTIEPSDLDGANLVIAATDDDKANDDIASWAAERGIWCVHAGDARRGSARIPAQGAAADVAIAVSSTDTPDPVRVKAIRDDLLSIIDEGGVDLRHRRPHEGKVVLVGAGPGAADLITVRGKRALADADVVVHDRLGTQELIASLPESVTVIDVGKRPDHHPVPQAEINQLLVDYALRGLNVVRLKGGDPFVLGRGGEEVLACTEARIAVEVVPGMTSAIAGPASAMIPVTHRGLSASFMVTSGHDGLGEGALAAMQEGSTVVVLMGMSALPGIVQQAREQAIPGDTAIAVVERATTAQQRSVSATLDTIEDAVAKAGLSNPAVIVVGEVAREGLLGAGK